jgi:hypothetical protein
MKNSRTLRQVVVSLSILAAFLSQVTWGLAGTTGGLSGTVLSDKGAPIAGATVRAVSVSESASTTTDAGGHYTFLTLEPDTYTVTATKQGYNPTSAAGITIFADQNLTLSLTINTSLRQIAQVSARATGNLVKPGTTVDVYAVNSATSAQLAISGGGNNLDSSYSAIYSQPGVVGLPGNFGFGQVFFIHGSSYDQIGYEFDGIPVNRSFDNYNANSLSNLGTQSVEVYTGGGPADATSPTLGGYINQVIKTGTFPGYAQLGGGIGTPGFYHQVTAEVGGATPDRNFSWYAAIRGSDMIPIQLDASNGGDLNPDGNNQFGQQGFVWNTPLLPLTAFGITSSNRGPWSDCTNAGATSPTNGSYLSPFLGGFYGTSSRVYACNVYSPLAATNAIALRGNDLSDRENVVNLHIGVPHKNDAGKDDIQILFDNFYYQTTAWDNLSTFGGLPFFGSMFTFAGTNPNGTGNYNTFLDNAFGAGTYNFLGTVGMPAFAGFCDYFNLYALFGLSPRCASQGPSPQPYFDGYQIVNAKFGDSALGSPNIVAPYYFPSSPANRPMFYGASPYLVSNTGNNGSIVKLQYQKNFGSSAYVRLFGYTFYSDWLQTDPNYSVTPFLVGGATAGDYELNTHTRGLYLQGADQINAQNLLSLTANYTTATVTRMNNAQWTFQPSGTPLAILQGANGQCYSAYNNQQGNSLIDPGYNKSVGPGDPVSCLSALAGAPYQAVQAGSSGCTGSSSPFTCLHIPVSAPSGTTWALAQNLAQDANLNHVGPVFYTAAFQDEFRPSDRWDINAGVRFESYGYQLGDYSSPSQAFWFSQVNATVCVAPVGLVQASQSDIVGGAPRYGLTPNAYVTFVTTAPGAACPYDPVLKQQLYHPGSHGVPLITLGGTGTITNSTWSPRLGFTYSISPNAVIRFSYGRYTQPTPTAFEQVLTYPDGYKMATDLYDSQYYNIGLSSVVHNNPIQFSNNFDASYEQHLSNTDWSFKLSPFYRYTSNQSVQVSLPGGLAGAFNSGTQRSDGVELAVQKGDVTRNGFSGQLSYTYTDSQLKYQLINGNNIISTMLTALAPFEGLEKINGGAPCYYGGLPDPKCVILKGVFPASPINKYRIIINPYYNYAITNAQLAADFPVGAFYPTYANQFPYALQTGDSSTIIPPNVFSGFVSWKHDKFQATLTGNLWEGTSYGSPVEIPGLNPQSCGFNQGLLVKPGAGARIADYQTCASSIAVPNPYTGQFDGIGQYRNPWDLNLGMQLGYDINSRIHTTVSMANILNACFGGSAEPWTAAYPPNGVICNYVPNTQYVGFKPGQGYFYGNSPHSSLNGTTGYPKVFDSAYAPSTYQIAAPFQVYFQAQVRL